MKTMSLLYGPDYLSRPDLIPDSLTDVKPITVQTFGPAAEIQRRKDDEI